MKEHNKDSWEARMRDRLNNMEEAPDDKLWAGIEQNIRPDRYRSLSAAAAVLLLFLGLGGLWLYSSGLEESPKVSATEGAIPDKAKEHQFLPAGEPTKEAEQERKANKELSDSLGAETNDTKVDKDIIQNADKPLPTAGKENALLNSVSEPQLSHNQNSGQTAAGTVSTDNHKTPSYTKENEVITPAESEPDVSVEITDAAAIRQTLSLWPKINKKPPVYYLAEELTLSLPEDAGKEKNPAGEEEIVKPKKHKKNQAEFWGAFNPMLTYRKVSPNQEDDIQITALHNDSPLSLKRAGVQTSAGVSFFVTPRLALKTGAFYRYTQNKWSYQYLEAYSDSVLITAAEEGLMKVEPYQDQKVRHIAEINNELGMLFGLQYSAGTSFRRNVNLDFQAAKNLASGKLFYYLAFDVDIERRLGENIFLYAGPSFMWGLNNASSAAYQSFELKPYSLGLKLGISYRLRRE